MNHTYDSPVLLIGCKRGTIKDYSKFSQRDFISQGFIMGKYSILFKLSITKLTTCSASNGSIPCIANNSINLALISGIVASANNPGRHFLVLGQNPNKL